MPNEKEENNSQKKNPRPKDWRVIAMQYGFAFLACGLLAFIWALISGIFKPYEEVVAEYHWNMANEAQKNYFLLTNAFFGSGVIFAGIGLLIVASNGGLFRMLVYGTRRFISLFQKDHNKIRFKTFYDYQVYCDGKPKSSFAFLLLVGLLYIGVSMIFLALYYGAAA